jgi:hypothetical protein
LSAAAATGYPVLRTTPKRLSAFLALNREFVAADMDPVGWVEESGVGTPGQGHRPVDTKPCPHCAVTLWIDPGESTPIATAR